MATKSTTIQKKKRGKFLTVMLVLTSVMIFLTYPVILNPQGLAQIQYHYGNPPHWFFWYALIDIVIATVAVVGLWMWKKWAIYLYVGEVLFSLFIETVFFKLDVFALVDATVMAALLYWAVYRKWKWYV